MDSFSVYGQQLGEMPTYVGFVLFLCGPGKLSEFHGDISPKALSCSRAVKVCNAPVARRHSASMIQMWRDCCCYSERIASRVLESQRGIFQLWTRPFQSPDR